VAPKADDLAIGDLKREFSAQVSAWISTGLVAVDIRLDIGPYSQDMRKLTRIGGGGGCSFLVSATMISTVRLFDCSTIRRLRAQQRER
jgi:hypothetical protein